MVKEKLTYVSNRKDLLERKVLKNNVWFNASGFLRIDSMTNDSSAVDPFDNTRIHPECYYINEWAPKICADSLEEEWTSSHDYSEIVSRLMKDCKKILERKLAKSKAWIDLWRSGRPMNGKTKYKETVKNDQGMLIEKEFGCELSDAMSLLLIDDYCNELESQDLGRHRLQFEDIKDELRFPWLDLRQPIDGPSQSEMFTILTGETPNSLHVGMKIGCVITRVEDKEVFDNRTNVSKRQQRAQVVTDSGMKGFIGMFEVSDDRIDENRFNMKEALPEGSKVMAVVLSVNMERQIVDLSIRPSYLKANDSWWVRKRYDLHQCRRWFEETARRGPVEKLFMPHFNESAALSAYESNLGEDADNDKMAVDNNDAPPSASKGTKAVVQRHVHHPLFINCSGKEAEDRLRANQGGFGSVIIRPSSKGPDSLAITWGFQPNWFIALRGRGAG
jgi:transcription elongation factor SPT6